MKNKKINALMFWIIVAAAIILITAYSPVK
jgi:hypothetical protein